MRITSDLWVSAYLRRVATMGAFATVARHGDDRGGAILVRVDRLDGTCDLYVPAPSGFDAQATDRRWVQAASGLTSDEVAGMIDRQIDFDSDVWVIDVEDRTGRSGLGDELVRPKD